jgi:hypothetical protein
MLLLENGISVTCPARCPGCGEFTENVTFQAVRCITTGLAVTRSEWFQIDLDQTRFLSRSVDDRFRDPGFATANSKKDR